MVKFLRRNTTRHLKLGKKRRKKQVWRKPTGRDNKMRERRRGYAPSVSIGYKKSKEDYKKIVSIKNIKDFEKIKKNDIIVVGKIGKKKKIEIAKKIKEMKIKVYNLNADKFLKKNIKKEAPEEKKDGGEKSKS